MGGMRKPSIRAATPNGGAPRWSAFINRAFVVMCTIDRFSGIPRLFLPAQKVKLILRRHQRSLALSRVVLRTRLSLPHAESHRSLHASTRSPVGERSLESVAPARTYLRECALLLCANLFRYRATSTLSVRTHVASSECDTARTCQRPNETPPRSPPQRIRRSAER